MPHSNIFIDIISYLCGQAIKQPIVKKRLLYKQSRIILGRFEQWLILINATIKIS